MARYHFVCHDCEAEAIVADRESAAGRRDDHVARTGHEASFAAFVAASDGV
ncbi:hypothetical protein SAMN05216388_1001316 [Halorientalis persicus]|jgi:hypothetical protein|uniref:DUF1059 domain-containing protein n=1 Tax=Halorientalis persicus TaxID=1367881 RepID=A0A1H8DL31_9EURY|nr:hypothetical protein [Halorientalis persicus]SEN08031.1 hypothetical protein SAMN05216388_1001316 [Halorientalis persicus]